MQEGLLKLSFCAVLSDFCSGTVKTATRNDQGSAQNSNFRPRLQPRDTSPASRATPVFLTCCGQTRHAGGPSQARCVRCGVRFLQRHDRDCDTKRSRRCSVSNFRNSACLHVTGVARNSGVPDMLWTNPACRRAFSSSDPAPCCQISAASIAAKIDCDTKWSRWWLRCGVASVQYEGARRAAGSNPTSAAGGNPTSAAGAAH